MKYILIDFENIQPTEIQINKLPIDFNILLFLGVNNKTLPVDLAKSLHRFKSIEFISIQKQGKNGLDFCLSYYIGRIIEKDKNTNIYILSKDKGYDPLINYIQSNKSCRSIQRLPELKLNAKTQNKGSSHYEKLISLLRNNEKLPKKKQKLINLIESHLNISTKKATLFVKTLEKNQIIDINDNNRIAYL